MSAVLWAVAAWFAGSVPAHQAGRFVPSRFAPALSGLILFILGSLAVYGMPAEGLLPQSLAATAALAGAQYPGWRSGGGRGLPVAAGALLVLSPVAIPLAMVVWGIGYVTTGYPAVGRIAMSLLTPPLVGLLAGWPAGLAVLPLGAMVALWDRPAARRVLLGTEVKHNWRAPA